MRAVAAATLQAWTPGFEPACRWGHVFSRLLFDTGVFGNPQELVRGCGEDGRTRERSRWLFSRPGGWTQRSRALPTRPTRFPGEDPHHDWERKNLRKVNPSFLWLDPCLEVADARGRQPCFSVPAQWLKLPRVPWGDECREDCGREEMKASSQFVVTGCIFEQDHGTSTGLCGNLDYRCCSFSRRCSQL